MERTVYLRDKDFKLRWMDGTEVDDEDIPFDNLHNPYRPEPYTKSRSPGECAYYKNGYVRMGSCGFSDINFMCKKGGQKC